MPAFNLFAVVDTPFERGVVFLHIRMPFVILNCQLAYCIKSHFSGFEPFGNLTKQHLNILFFEIHHYALRNKQRWPVFGNIIHPRIIEHGLGYHFAGRRFFKKLFTHLNRFFYINVEPLSTVQGEPLAAGIQAATQINDNSLRMPMQKIVDDFI